MSKTRNKIFRAKSGTSKTLTRVCFVVSYIIPVDRDLDVKKNWKDHCKINVPCMYTNQSKLVEQKCISLSCINWLPSFKPENIYIFVFVMGFVNLSVVSWNYYFPCLVFSSHFTHNNKFYSKSINKRILWQNKKITEVGSLYPILTANMAIISNQGGILDFLKGEGRIFEKIQKCCRPFKALKDTLFWPNFLRRWQSFEKTGRKRRF